MKNKSVAFQFFKRSLITNMLTMLLPMLIVMLYSFFHIVRESGNNATRNNQVILSQVDSVFETFFTDIDNAYLILATDSDVSERLSEVFEEKEQSLNSIRFVEILSANFRNIVFTNSYVQNIYFYINNDDHKVLTTLNKRTTILSDAEFAHISEALSHDAGDDLWFEIYDASPLDIGRGGKTMQIYRRLYYRATRKTSGLIVYSINLEAFRKQIAASFPYNEQMLLLLDHEGNCFYDVAAEEAGGSVHAGDGISLAGDIDFEEADTAQITEALAADKHTVSLHGEKYVLTTLSSQRSYGLQYVLLTPVEKIYSYAAAFLLVSATLFLCVLIATAVMAYFKTRSEYNKVSRVVDLLADPGAVSESNLDAPKRADPFSYIQFNIMKLFIEQDYLKMQNLQKNTQLKLSQIQALQHQINPHFLNNTLNIIYWKAIALGGGENECSSMIQSLSEVMRYSLSNPQEDARLSEEIVFIRKYISLMKQRFPNVFEEEIEIDQTCADLPIKKMLLQPLVENAINHGLRAKKEKGRLVIQATPCDNGVLISVFDDGAGISPDVLSDLRRSLQQVTDSVTDSAEEETHLSDQHIGLVNPHLRLVLAYGKEAGLTIESKEGEYTRFSFRIPN